MSDRTAHTDYARWQGYTRRTKPGHGDAFESFGHDLADFKSHQRPWVARREPFDASHCEACAHRIWTLSNQYEHWSILSALTNFPISMEHEGRGLEAREARFLLELFTAPEIEPLIHLTSRTTRLSMDAQWSAHVEVALARSKTPWSHDVLRQHLGRFFKVEDASTSRHAHQLMCRSAACAFFWVRHAYGLDLALELCFELMDERWLGWGLHCVGSTRGSESRAIALLQDTGVDLDALVTPTPEAQEVRQLAWILERCPDQTHIYEWAPVIVDFCKTSSTDNFPAEDRVLFALEDYHALMETLKEYRITLFVQDVWLIYGRYGEACIEDLSALIMSRANKARRNDLLKALWPVCNEKLAPMMLDASLEVTSAEVATWWLTRQGADATLGLMRQARRRGKVGHQARTMLDQIVAEGHGEEVRALLPLLDDAKLVSHIEEEILAHAPSDPEMLDTAQDEGDALQAFPEALAPLEAALPIGGEDEEVREAFMRDLDHVLHLERAPAVRVRGSDQVASKALLSCVLWCMALAWPLDRRKGKKEKAREAREALQEVLRATLPRLREVFEPEDLASLTRHVFEAWWAHDRPAEQMWCIWLLGYCGGEEEAWWMREKMRMMNRWFPKGHLRQSTTDVTAALAVMDLPMSRTMLDVLREEGRSDLICISARDARAQLQERHGWDDATWQDLSVPTVGLNALGKRRFDYGTRHFDLVFRGAFEISLVDEHGKIYNRLPASRKSDDQEAVQQARQTYKEVSEQLSVVVARQRTRLEACLSAQHGWAPSVWLERIASHPLMRHFARMLVWKVVRDEMVEGVKQERIERLFLWTEEGEAIGLDYEPISCEELFASGDLVRLMHPCDLEDQERAKWVEVLMAFEVVQPVRQLERSCQGIEALSHKVMVQALRREKRWLIQDSLVRFKAWDSMTDRNQEIALIWADWGSWRVFWVYDEAIWKDVRRRELIGTEPEGCGFFFVGLDEVVSKPGVAVPEERVPAWLLAEVRTSLGGVLEGVNVSSQDV